MGFLTSFPAVGLIVITIFICLTECVNRGIDMDSSVIACRCVKTQECYSFRSREARLCSAALLCFNHRQKAKPYAVVMSAVQVGSLPACHSKLQDLKVAANRIGSSGLNSMLTNSEWFFHFLFLGVELIYNVMLVSGVPQSDSDLYGNIE